ncbi:hypothetical protein HDU96_002818 [Phlyctochytrium bullatum]|nr:hypothetical protein HDU96_002818 [Phlyctochytrium bullatum]
MGIGARTSTRGSLEGSGTGLEVSGASGGSGADRRGSDGGLMPRMGRSQQTGDGHWISTWTKPGQGARDRLEADGSWILAGSKGHGGVSGGEPQELEAAGGRESKKERQGKSSRSLKERLLTLK